MQNFPAAGDYVYGNMSACPGVISTLRSEAMHCKASLYPPSCLSKQAFWKSLEPKGLIFSERFLEERQPKLMPGKITTSLFILHSSWHLVDIIEKSN